MRSLCVAALVPAVLAMACGRDAGPDVDAVRAAGVGVRATGCGLTARVASGARIGDPAVIVTSAHVVAGADSITTIEVDGSSRPAVVLAFDPAADLAILDAGGSGPPGLDVAGADAPAEALLVTWTPSDGVTAEPVRVTRHLRVTIEDIWLDETVERSAIEFEGDVVVGDSGGVVVVGGAVAGVVYARSRSRDGVGFAVDAAHVSSALERGDDDLDGVDRCVP